MSVMTTADEKRASAKEKMEQAARDLSEICLKECWGADEFTDEALTRFETTMCDLLRLARNL